MIKTVFAFAGVLSLAVTVAAQEPPPVTPPPVTPPVQAPAVQPTPPPAPVAEVPVKLSTIELQRRLEAIFVMEGVFQKHVALAANATQREIENFTKMDTGMRSMMFSRAQPRAQGTYLEDYGVVFQVTIPSYLPSVAQIFETLNRSRPQATDPAQPASLTAPRSDVPFDPDALYVEAVRRYLVDAMLVSSRSLDLRPGEWLAVSARGDDGLPVEFSQPSIMVLRLKGSDLIDFVAGRLADGEIRKRIIVQGFSGR